LKYLFDENCSVSDKFLEEHPGCENVKYKISKGVKDKTILERTNKDEFLIVTKDIDLALDALIAEFKVVYHEEDKHKDNFLQASKLSDSIISDFKSLKL